MRKKTCLASFFGVFAMLAIGLLQQTHAAAVPGQSSISVAEASRRAKAQQKNQKPPAKVYTDDDIANLKGSISIVGPAPAAPPAAEGDAKAADAAAGTQTPAVAGTPTDKAAAAASVKDEAYWRKEFADARKKLADDSKELDVLQREFNLKQQQYYSDPNVALREQNSRKDLNDTQAQIYAKQAEVEKDKQAISDLDDALRKAGGDPGWGR